MRVMYEVAIHLHGKRMVEGGINNPCAGLLVPKHQWLRVNARPLGLARAKALADAQDCHAVVTEWSGAEKFHDNGKPPRVPSGWWPADAIHAGDPRRMP